MSIGYVCLCLGVLGTGMKSCNLKNADPKKLYEITDHNLNALERIIDYNVKNKIKLFRISSDIVPFGSNKVNDGSWKLDFKDRLNKLGEKIILSGMRVSMHPGQYTVLNSTTKEVVIRAIEDLEYHVDFLDLLGVDKKHKVVLHVGGIYNDKESAVKRFIENYNLLSEKIKARLVIENDDRSYNIKDVLEISKVTKAPTIFDNLHNFSNPSDENRNDNYWIQLSKQTWGIGDGPQKIHYSQQDFTKKNAAHSSSIRVDEFMDFYNSIDNKNLDIMLEVKDKNISALKCLNSVTLDKKIKKLEVEWGLYKYTVLEKAPNIYKEIRILLKNKNEYPVQKFYQLIEEALNQETTKGNAINAAQHVWGYFSEKASGEEKTSFSKKILGFKKDELSIKNPKNFLWKLSLKYNEVYLINSYYFVYL